MTIEKTSSVKRYIIKDRDGNIKANGVSHTSEEIEQIKAAGYKVKESADENRAY